MQVRLDAHGVAQETRPSGHIIRLAQPLRGLIPMMFDTASVVAVADRAGRRGCSSART